MAQPTGTSADTFRVVLAGDIDYIDPALAQSIAEWQIEYATCLKLVNYRDEGGVRSAQLFPEAAAGFPTISRDGLTYVFRIRPNLRFSDGTRITPWSFAYALHRTLTKRMASQAQPLFDDIQGAIDVSKGTATKVRGIRVLPRNRLRIRIEARSTDLLQRLATPYACAIRTDTPINADGVPAPLVGSGPYYVAAWTPQRSLVLRRNRFYRGPRPHKLDVIEYALRLAPGDALARVEQGSADWLSLTSVSGDASVNERFARHPRARVNPRAAVRMLVFDATAGRPFSNTRLRRAVALVLDREEIEASAGPRLGLPFDHFIPPTAPGHRAARIYQLRPDASTIERARQLAAPYVPVTVSMEPATPFLDPRLDAVARNLARIGITVRFHRACAGYCEGDLKLVVVDPDNEDVAEFLREALTIGGFFRPGGRKFPAWGWQSQIESASRLSRNRRLEFLGRLDLKMAREAVPAAALSVPNSRELFSERVGCFQFHRVYHVDLAALCLRP